MSIQDIEQVTIDFIRTYSNKEYVGKIKVEKLNPIGYLITLYPLGEYVPMVFYAELEGDKFLQFLREEIRNKLFFKSDYGVLNKIEPNLCLPINTSCSCNDK